MKTGAETGVMLPQIVGHHGVPAAPEARRGKQRILPRYLQRECGRADTLVTEL